MSFLNSELLRDMRVLLKFIFWSVIRTFRKPGLFTNFVLLYIASPFCNNRTVKVLGNRFLEPSGLVT